MVLFVAKATKFTLILILYYGDIYLFFRQIIYFVRFNYFCLNLLFSFSFHFVSNLKYYPESLYVAFDYFNIAIK